MHNCNLQVKSWSIAGQSHYGGIWLWIYENCVCELLYMLKNEYESDLHGNEHN